jgi:DNA transposition AAA+ family ATPase
MARSWWSLGFARDRVDLLESQRSWLSLDYARDDKLKNARDDKLQNARDDKLKNARDDKLKNARDDKLNKTFIHQNKRSPEERIAVGRTRFTPPLPIP